VNSLSGYLIVFVGAGLGGAVRHGINRTALPFGTSFPWQTFGINIAGSLLMGLLAGWFAFRVHGSHELGHFTKASGEQLRLFLTTGILGGFTTFSAFSLEAVLLWERGRLGAASAYVAGSVILALMGLLMGMALMRP
jgi:CrcB protein